MEQNINPMVYSRVPSQWMACQITCDPYPLDVDEVMLGVPVAGLFGAFAALFRTFFVTLLIILVEMPMDW